MGSRSYKIEVRSGGLDSVGNCLRAVLGDKPETAVIISNPTVYGKYGRRVQSSLSRARFRAKHFIIPDGERYKTLKTAESIYTWLIDKKVERKDAILSLGGGVIGDVAGFVAVGDCVEAEDSFNIKLIVWRTEFGTNVVGAEKDDLSGFFEQIGHG